VSSTQSYATFYVDELYFGILTSQVVELTKGTEVTPVPLAPYAVSGLINLRGQIVTAIDMRKRLKFKPNPSADSVITVFIRNNGVLFGLSIDKVSDILELEDSDLEPPLSNMPASAVELIIGYYKLPGKLLFILDADTLISGCLAE
jgi:purine-binding chemotaxis protein CheW